MEQASIAAGFWGDGDFGNLKLCSDVLWPLISIDMTVVPGETRKNVTIVDVAAKSEMHLRDKTKLYSGEVFIQLGENLRKIVKNGDICVFAGAMPDNEFLDDVIEIVKNCHNAGAKIVLDTSGPALSKIIETGLVWLVKPNISELNTLFNTDIADNLISFVQAGKDRLSVTSNLLISRGEKGAILVNKKGAWEGKALNRKDVLGTVGCGDYLLAGFLKSWIESENEELALAQAIKIATLRAWDLTQNMKYNDVAEEVKVGISKISCW